MILPKADIWRKKKKTDVIPDEKSHGLGTQRESYHEKKEMAFFPDD